MTYNFAAFCWEIGIEVKIRTQIDPSISSLADGFKTCKYIFYSSRMGEGGGLLRASRVYN